MFSNRLLEVLSPVSDSFVAIMLRVIFHRLSVVEEGVVQVSGGDMRLMSSERVIHCIIMFRSLAVVVRRQIVVLGSRTVVFCALVTRVHTASLYPLL